MTDAQFRNFTNSDAALVAYTLGYNIDLFKYSKETLINFNVSSISFLDTNTLLAIEDTINVLKSSTTISQEDIVQINLWLIAVLKFRICVATNASNNIVSVENKEDFNFIAESMFGFKHLPSDFQVALLNCAPGDSQKVGQFANIFKERLAEVTGG